MNQCSCSASGKNLVVCIDGTANQFSEKNSNVVELYSRLVKDRKQLTYYNSGIGTYVKDSKSLESWFSFRAWKQRFKHGIDEAIAWNFKAKVLNAYQWLSENYEPGDRIFLFGFSRGAYQVRVIAGMIKLVGLLHKGNNDQIKFAYELYKDSISNQKRSDRIDPRSMCEHFKTTLARPGVKVHFVGTWDTVSSLGIIRGRSLPETTTGMSHVCTFRQALALDELRVKFLPEYANGGAGPSDAKHIKEVWFAGFHSDIGGGNAPNPDNTLFGPALRWMTYEAITFGLAMQPHQGEWSRIPRHPSMTWFWKLFEYGPIPIPRLSYVDADSVEWPPHCESPRQVQAGQLIHESVLSELAEGYYPKARIYNGVDWDESTLKGLSMIEGDPYIQADEILSRIDKLDWWTGGVSKADVDVLMTLASSGKSFFLARAHHFYWSDIRPRTRLSLHHRRSPGCQNPRYLSW
ncbi:hypothetical protein DFH09DRAFT_902966 [Mycena vulgaris]|nr:hypothetical protein DFH09DRAFT_902966 [Mycena vulgaris]